MKKQVFGLFIAGLLWAITVFAQNATNLPVIVLPSTAQTAATITTVDQTNTYWRTGVFFVNVSAYTSGNYTPHIQSKDPVSGTYVDLLVGTAISATGITIMDIGYPSAIPNVSTPAILPRTWRFELVGASTPIMTISVGAVLGN